MIKVNVSGDGMIFRKEFTDNVQYSTTLSKKLVDGTWENGFIPIQFKKDVFIHHKTKIQLDNAWLSFYLTKTDKKPVFYIFCNEYTILEDGEVANTEPVRPAKRVEKPTSVPSGFELVEDDDTELPF
ncbi:MAG: hypothetical protein WCJ62_11970 [Flavobacterium sp.]